MACSTSWHGKLRGSAVAAEALCAFDNAENESNERGLRFRCLWLRCCASKSLRIVVVRRIVLGRPVHITITWGRLTRS